LSAGGTQNISTAESPDVVSFTSKTKLIDHYEKTLGATHIGGHKMVIYPQDALKLIRKYFPT